MRQPHLFVTVTLWWNCPLSTFQAASLVEAKGGEVPMAYIDATSPDVDELVASYGFITPAARLFRRRIMFDFDLAGFQTAEFLLEHGLIDFIVDRRQMRAKISQVLGYLAR